MLLDKLWRLHEEISRKILIALIFVFRRGIFRNMVINILGISFMILLRLYLLLLLAKPYFFFRLSRNLREDDARSDVNTLISSVDSREFTGTKKNGYNIVRRTEEL